MNLRNLKKILIFVILPIAVPLILAVSYFHLLDSYELITLDMRFLLRPAIKTTDKVVFIEIAEDTFEKLGRFPFGRNYHALLVKALSGAGAKYIFFDIFFSEPQEYDKEFEEAMKLAGNVYLPFALEIDTRKKAKLLSASGYRAKSLDSLRLAAKGDGHINIVEDIDGKFRKVPLYIKHQDALYPFISFLISCDYLGISRDDIKFVPAKFIMCGKTLKVPLDENSNMLINFSGKWGATYKHYSYVDVLQSYLADMSAQKPTLDLNIFKEKVCIICLTAAGTVDLHPNPFQQLYPAAGVHAEVFNSMVNRSFVSRVPRRINSLILIVLMVITCIVTLKTKPIKGLVFSLVTVFIFIIVGIVLFNCCGLWIDFFYPICVIFVVYLSVTVYKYVSEWKTRLLMEKELDIAKKIQESFLPKEIRAPEGLDVTAAMFTARQVGGDLYDFVELGKDKFGVMIGDVSGKGVPASLFMAMVVGAFKFFASQQDRPEEALLHLNSKLVREGSSNLFVTIFYSIFDVAKKAFIYTNGGHMPVLYLHKGTKCDFLDVEEGMPLGLMEGNYCSARLNFEKGDIFVYYTDGVTEAMNSKLELYGKDRFTKVVQDNHSLSAKEILEAIGKDIRKFEPRTHQHDDITLIVVKVI
ncbi:MAG: SpoIIE family protein phosphatase [Candidatus Omnitrophota bacterium]|nr:SpoIIE family protein phosphatase [Candidatus Omnitrophota bacterium]